MDNMQPEGELFRRAVRWASEQRRDNPSTKLSLLVDEAALRFNLSPLEADYLWRTLSTPTGNQEHH